MRGGGQDDVRQALATWCHQEARKAEDRREFLGVGADAPPIRELPAFRPARVVADQRSTLLAAGEGVGGEQEFVAAVAIEIAYPCVRCREFREIGLHQRI